MLFQLDTHIFRNVISQTFVFINKGILLWLTFFSPLLTIEYLQAVTKHWILTTWLELIGNGWFYVMHSTSLFRELYSVGKKWSFRKCRKICMVHFVTIFMVLSQLCKIISHIRVWKCQFHIYSHMSCIAVMYISPLHF